MKQITVPQDETIAGEPFSFATFVGRDLLPRGLAETAQARLVVELAPLAEMKAGESVGITDAAHELLEKLSTMQGVQVNPVAVLAVAKFQIAIISAEKV